MKTDKSLPQKLKDFQKEAECDAQSAAILILAEAVWGVAAAIENNNIGLAIDKLTSDSICIKANLFPGWGEDGKSSPLDVRISNSDDDS